MKAKIMGSNGCGKYILTSKPKNKQEWFDIYVELVCRDLKDERCFSLRNLCKGTDFQDTIIILMRHYNNIGPLFCDERYNTIRKPIWKESEMKDIYAAAKWKVAAVSYKLEVSEIEANIF